MCSKRKPLYYFYVRIYYQIGSDKHKKDIRVKSTCETLALERVLFQHRRELPDNIYSLKIIGDKIPYSKANRAKQIREMTDTNTNLKTYRYRRSPKT